MQDSFFARLVVVVSLLFPLGACSQQKPAAAVAAPGANLPEAVRALLERYEKVRAALAADKFDDARFQAGQLATEAEKAVATAGADPAVGNLAAAAKAMSTQSRADRMREEFKPASAAAIKLASGSPGFYVINCPMTKDGDWLQTDPKVSNPYFGKSMLECGVAKK